MVLLLVVTIIILTTSIVSATDNDTQIIHQNTIDDKQIKSDDYKTEDNTIESPDIECYVNDEVEIPYTTKKPLTDGIISYYRDDHLLSVKDISKDSSVYKYNTTGLKAGQYTIYIEYTASNKNNIMMSTSTLTIHKYQTHLEEFTTTINNDNQIDISFILQSDTKPKTSGYVTLYDEQTPITNIIIPSSGIIKTTLPSSYNDKIITISFHGDNISTELNTSKFIHVPKYKLNIYTPSIRGYVGDNITSNITLNTSRKITDGYIRVLIDDILYDVIKPTSNTTLKQFSLTNLSEAQHSLQVRYSDSNIFTDAVYSTIININKINTRIYANNITAYKNSEIKINASVRNYVDITNNGIVELLIDDESIQTNKLTTNTTSFIYQLTDDMSIGVHKIKIAYQGSERYNRSELELRLTICKYPLKLYVRNISLSDDGLIEFDVRSTSYLKDMVDEGDVNIIYNNKIIAASPVTCNMSHFKTPLTAGEYLIQIRYLNSDTFNETTLNTTINISKINTTTRIYQYINNQNILNITTTTYTSDYVNLTKGQLLIKLDDELIYSGTIQNTTNHITYNMSNLKSGNYTLNVTYNGTGKYQSSTNTMIVEYIPHQSTIYIRTNTTIRTTPNNDVIINATLQDYQLNMINLTINATLKIGNNTYAIKFFNGKLNYTYHVGVVDDCIIPVTIKTKNSTYYKATTSNITLKIARINTYISAPTTIITNKLEVIHINTTLNANKKLLTGIIKTTIKINNKTYMKTNYTNGILNIPSNILRNNYYKITILTQQTNTHKPAIKNINLTLNKRPTYIISKNITSITSKQTIINATIYDSLTRRAISENVKVTIKINQKTQITQNIQNGNILYGYKNNHPKTYNLTIISGENTIYNMSTWNGTITYTKLTPQIKTNNIKTTINNKITIKAQILESGRPITTPLTIIIKINRKTIDTIKINNSYLNYKYQLDARFTAKTHNITIIVADNEKYLKSESTTALIISKQNPQIKINPISAHQGETIHIKAIITDETNHPINSKINIKIARRSIITTNITNGIIDYTYTIPTNFKKGIYELLIQTSETSLYEHATKYNTIKII